MAERLESYLENPLFAVLTLIGIVVSVVLFVLFYRNRKEDRLTRRRFLLLFVLMLLHTFLCPLAFLSESDILILPWIFLIPILFFVQIIYRVLYRKWENRDLRIATTAFAFYTAYLFFLTVLIFFVTSFH